MQIGRKAQRDREREIERNGRERERETGEIDGGYGVLGMERERRDRNMGERNGIARQTGERYGGEVRQIDGKEIRER